MTFVRSTRFYVLTVAFSAAALIAAGCGAATPASSPPPTLGSSAGPSLGATPAPSDGDSPAPTDVTIPEPSADPHEVLLSVETRGGRCVGGPCGGAVYLDRDGLVHLAAKPPNELGVVPPELMADLDEAIRATDFPELFSHPFGGQCPTDYDGQELVFEIVTADGIQRIASCTVEVNYDSPLFMAVKAAVGEFVPQLNQ